MILYKVVLNLEYLAEMLKCDHSNKKYSALLSCSTVYKAVENCSNVENCGWNTCLKTKATVQLLPVVLFIMYYKIFLTSESVDKML